nr:unnamed protein product [Callosobruchus chinensis]
MQSREGQFDSSVIRS